jgi:hypothetical protein
MVGALGDNVKTSRRKSTLIQSTQEQVASPAPAKAKAEDRVRHTLRIPASMDKRYRRWKDDQLDAGAKKSEVDFNTFATDAIDNALKAVGYGETS